MISRRRLFLYRLLFGLFLVSFWELSSGRLIDPFWVSSPSRVFGYLYEVIADGSIFRSPRDHALRDLHRFFHRRRLSASV